MIMRLISPPYRVRVALAGTGAVILALGTLANLAAPTPTVASDLLSQAQHTAAEKVLAFGLTPNPEPYVPEGLQQSRNPAEGSRGTIGLSDDRIPMTSSSYPWSAIGRLQNPVDENRISICTGSLVAPDVVLTNAHCVVDPETNQVKSDVIFKPNFRNGQVDDEADIANVVDVIYGTDFSDSDDVPHPNDWAFAKLDRPLGDKYGTLAWTQLSMPELLNTYEGQLILAGYSGDFPENAPGRTAGVHDGCSILGEAQGSLLHDCDTYGGSSGGPILAVIDDEFRIVALNSAGLSESRVNTTTGEVLQTQGIINYGVKLDPIISFLSQSTGESQ
jgi:V8-like Glu-specific endopeptidase